MEYDTVMEGTRVQPVGEMTDEQFLKHLKIRHPELLAFDPDRLYERHLYEVGHNTQHRLGGTMGVEPPSNNHFHSED